MYYVMYNSNVHCVFSTILNLVSGSVDSMMFVEGNAYELLCIGIWFHEF